MITSSLFAVASLLLSFFPLPEKVEYSLAEVSIGKKATLSYSIGQIELHKSGGTTLPLSLEKTPDDYKVTMISEPFKVSSGDSIYFRRLLSITDARNKKIMEQNFNSIQFAQSYKSVEEAKTGVKLHDTLFNKESSVYFIADLMYQNDTAIIASLDTITVKRNTSGYLRAYTAPNRPEAVSMPLANIDPNRPVVIRIWMQMLLPQEAKLGVMTRSLKRDKKPYNIISTNASMVVPGMKKK